MTTTTTPPAQTPKPQIIIIEGGIGAGKSSLVDATVQHAKKLFGPDAKVVVIKESVYFPFLDLCLGDPKRMALPFQVCMARDRIETMRAAIRYYNQGCIVLVDRGLPGDIAFAKQHAASGNISAANMGIYFGLLSHAVPNFVPTALFGAYELPDGAPSDIKVTSNCAELVANQGFAPDDMHILYLRTKPEVAFARMQARGIKEEKDGYELGWFEELSSIYDGIIDKFRDEWGEARVATLDYNEAREMDGGVLTPDACAAVWETVLRI